ncbi:hypothetical protein ACDA63_00510 [Uliginosibacterium sp. sgz301328]|uniref:hypothetical protein n=1 Tax=Uliginosibacterium sp. sgz301328 TaxID=3243764 RepID=UPI00359ED736
MAEEISVVAASGNWSFQWLRSKFLPGAALGSSDAADDWLLDDDPALLEAALLDEPALLDVLLD